MTLLSIIQKTCPAIGLQPIPTSVVGSTSAQVQTLLALSEIGGEELAEAHPWTRLTHRVTFNGIAQYAQTGQPPTALYDRFPATQRIWSNSRRTWLTGPMSTNEWDNILTQPLTIFPGYWCIIDGVINIAPAPATTESFNYTYLSKNWIRPVGGASDGTGDVAAWGADTDVPLLDEGLLRLDLIWRWKQAKGLDYAEDMSTFERKKEKAIARDRGPREITTTQPYPDGPPDGYWPGVITP